MTLKTRSYNHGSELSRLAQEITQEYSGQDIRIVVPSRHDKSYWPENRKIWTWDDIYKDICTTGNLEGRKSLAPPDHMLILRTILRQVLEDCAIDTETWPGLRRSGFPEILSKDIRELMNEAVTPDKLIYSPESDNPSEFLLPEVYSRYTKYLQQYNLLDSAQVYTEAYRLMKDVQTWGRDYVMILAGFMSFNHGQLELVRALRDRCAEVVILKPEAEMPDFHDIDYQFSMIRPANSSSGKIIELPVYEPSLEPEVAARYLALWASGEREDFPGFDGIAIMISPGREESYAEAFKRYRIPYDFMSGSPISQTLPGKILATLNTLRLRNFPAYDTAMLLTQTCFAGKDFPVLRAYRAGIHGLDTWENYLAEHEAENEAFSPALTVIRAIKTFTDTLSRKNTPAQIMAAFHAFLTAKGLWLDRYCMNRDNPEFDESIREIASAIETVAQKDLALHELLPDIGPVQDFRLNNDDAYDFLESWSRKTNTRAPVQVSNAVRIFTGNPPVLAFFPVFIMTGITSKSWSGNITSSPLLGNEERRKLDENGAHVPTSSEKALQREALFRRLIQTGENLTVIIRPELDDEGRPVSESPFMARFRDDHKDSWDIQALPVAGINILLGDDSYIFPEIDPKENITRNIPVISKKAHAVGASDIHELLACPFLWWQKRQAKLYEQETDIVSPAEWGNMMHGYWRRVWARYREDMNASGKFFMHIALDEWAKFVKEEDGDYRKLICDTRLKRKLDGIAFRAKRLAGVQADVIDELRAAGYEYRRILLEEEAHLKADIDGVAFLGQCDRIDIMTSPEGQETAFIADYKEGTGTNSEDSMNIKGYSWNVEDRQKFTRGLQLSVYAALYPHDLTGVYILGLEDGKISGSFKGNSGEIFKPYKSDKFSNSIIDRIDEGNYAMNCAVNILKERKFAPEYRADTCRYCRIKSLCRKGEFRGMVITDDEED